MNRSVCALAVIFATVAICTPATAQPSSPGDQPDPLAATSDVIAVVVPYVRDVIEAERIQHEVAALQSAIGEMAQAIAAERARSAPRTVSPEPPARPGSSAGGHSDAWWQGVAMCEQGGRNDPYFGYFSFMDGSQGGRPWADQVAAGNALLARAGREVGPWAAACVAAGYRASPGG